MLCKATLQDPVASKNKNRSCWLPADPSSSFGYCRRCHFDKVTNLLDVLRIQYEHIDVPEDESVLRQPFFLEEALHKGREQAFLSLLNVVRQKNPTLFKFILNTLRNNTRFQQLAIKVFLHHPPGPRCALYKSIMRFCHYNPIDTIHELPGVCWHCLSWVFKKREVVCGLPLFTMGFVTAIHEISSAKIYCFGIEPFLDILLSFHIYDRKLYAEELCDHILQILPTDKQKDFLLDFFKELPLLPHALQKDIEAYLPPQFKTDDFKQEVYENALCFLRGRQQKIKEELMEITWHPDRFLEWCVDRTDFAWGF